MPKYTVPADDLTRPVPPYTYNPSSWNQRVIIAILAFVAAAISAHLAVHQWGLIEGVWDPVFGEQSSQVVTSDVSKKMYRWIGIHDAALGLFAYLGDGIFALAGSTRRWQYRPWLVIIFGLDVIPLGIVSAILVLIQAFVLGQWCFLCLVTAGISLILVYWAWDEVRVCLTYLWRVRKQTGSSKSLWDAVCGKRSKATEQAAESIYAKESA